MARNPNPYIKQPSVSISFLQNYRIPHTLCPICGNQPVRLTNTTYTTCASHHKFYECPTCMDTRVSDKRENAFYCGLLHPYHLCAIHKIPVVGVTQMNGRCTCVQNPRSIIRQKPVTQWESPFV